MIVGYTNPGYPVIRTILGACPGVSYRRIRPLGSLLSCPAGHFSRILGKSLLNSYIGGIGGRIDVLHFFNIVALNCWSQVPFVTTFETTVPRYQATGWLYSRAVKAMQSPRCRRLLALSECTKRRQAKILREVGAMDVMDKVQVLHPPQELFCSEADIERRLGQKKNLHFMYVGRSFFHKGGGEALKVLVEVRKYYPVRLTIIGDPDDKDYMHHEATDDAVACYQLMAANSDWITFHKSLPNREVLDLMRTADVGLLPTRGDTYGFSVLEMQAAGIPCITTNLRALPEINNDFCGWMIEVPKTADEDALWNSVEDRDRYVSRVREALFRICTQIVEHPECLCTKALASLRRVRNCHSPECYAEQLMVVYNEAVEGER